MFSTGDSSTAHHSSDEKAVKPAEARVDPSVRMRFTPGTPLAGHSRPLSPLGKGGRAT